MITLEQLNARIASTPAAEFLIPDNGETLVAGQVWTRAERNPVDQPSWTWLVMYMEDSLPTCVPMSPWGELVEAKDLLLRLDGGDPYYIGVTIEGELPRSAFGRCLGRLPDHLFERIAAASRDADDPVKRRDYEWGTSSRSMISPSANYRYAIVRDILKYNMLRAGL